MVLHERVAIIGVLHVKLGFYDRKICHCCCMGAQKFSQDAGMVGKYTFFAVNEFLTYDV